MKKRILFVCVAFVLLAGCNGGSGKGSKAIV